jgi:very-short-patch-repair endonuclease
LNYSKISQELFIKLDLALNEQNSYFATKNQELVKCDAINKKTYLYDYAIPSIKFCIEFNGDLYHANPTRYTPSEIPKFKSNKKTALEIWKHDEAKNNFLRSLGFDVIVVWESDYRQNPDGVLTKIVNYVNEIRANKSIQD